MVENRILIIDSLNMFFRAYIMDPSLSSNGQPIGGIKGSLKIMQKLIRETRPDKVFVVWDGPGGSKRRKSVDKNYKAGRKPLRLNRNVRTLTENEEVQNRVWQHLRLIEYYNNMPIVQFMFPGIEADDVIAQIVGSKRLKNDQKVIVSSDKDFIQLCDEKTILYRPTQKEILNTHRVVEKFGIHPNNFVLARAMAGDKSDNLEGVGRVGLKTAIKGFPFLKEEKSYTLKDIYDHCRKTDKELTVYKNILENKETLERNYGLMQLYSPNLSPQVKAEIKRIVNESKMMFNKTEFKKMMLQDGFGEYDWSTMNQGFNRIVLDNS
jgi:DNA polymerase-1